MTNLNRQFLFHRKHVGMSKSKVGDNTINIVNKHVRALTIAQVCYIIHVSRYFFQVARESALSFVPDADITAIHGSVTTQEYGVSFYQKVSL